MDHAEITSNPASKEKFLLAARKSLAQQVSSRAGIDLRGPDGSIDLERIQVVSVRPGSIVVEFVILAPPGTSAEAEQRLAEQLQSDPGQRPQTFCILNECDMN